jgi:glucose-1-phosphatase
MTIEVVVVDLGGVAAAFLPLRRLEALAAESRLAGSEIDRRVWGSGFDAQAEAGVFSADETIDGLLDALDGCLDLETLIRCWAIAFEPVDLVVNLLARVAVRKVLFTNNGPMIDRCLDGPLAGLRSVFDDIICSWHLGARKPTDLAFARASERLDVPPDRLVLLDDDERNVVAARRNGWHADRIVKGTDVPDVLARHGVECDQGRGTLGRKFPGSRD